MTARLRALLPRVLRGFVLACLAATGNPGQAAEPSPARWEPEIKAFEAGDKTNPPPQHAILFIGSSSIRMWKTLAEDFAGLPVINRGFGGSQMSDAVFYAERIALPYRPRQVVVYAGDNDIAAGRSPEQVLADCKELVAKVHRALPGTAIAFIAIKPSPSRWKFVEQVRRANGLIAEFSRSEPNLAFIDVFTPMLGPDGQPRGDLFVADKLHLSREGYNLWADQVRPHLIR